MNEKCNVSKKTQTVSGVLHTSSIKAWHGKVRDTLAAAEGFASFVYMVKGEEGKTS